MTMCKELYLQNLLLCILKGALYIMCISSLKLCLLKSTIIEIVLGFKCTAWNAKQLYKTK